MYFCHVQLVAQKKPSNSKVKLDVYKRQVHKHCTTQREVSFYANKLFITPRYLSTVIQNVTNTTAKSIIDKHVSHAVQFRCGVIAYDGCLARPFFGGLVFLKLFLQPTYGTLQRLDVSHLPLTGKPLLDVYKRQMYQLCIAAFNSGSMWRVYDNPCRYDKRKL